MKFIFIFFSIFLIGCGSVSPRFTSVVPKNKSVIIENEVKPKAPIKIENSAIPQEKMMDEVLKYLGTTYKLGGNSKEGIDCSAFTQTIFSQSIGNNLPRSTSEQFKIGKEINLEQIVFGDLLFLTQMELAHRMSEFILAKIFLRTQARVRELQFHQLSHRTIRKNLSAHEELQNKLCQLYQFYYMEILFFDKKQKLLKKLLLQK